ncbi:putative E3 ubiquitin-protein ligase [Hortaea werneckii]|nr:putative E3 ubiquitin-protein ligase [Hortaea werneckii]KAI6989547.1 putative E3 ubiquitin-protein ligase [Hortaea werneckii]KAI7143074.1 putative E3 ubiquitin-protein ligase [Hortaea werneckii]KAI7170862.1 putative E3 ubiquitin-protein ligase [Hortaea werneckii]
MGRIKKVATERHNATLSPAVQEFVTQTASIPLHQLPQKLSEFPQHWPFPRGDLYHWIPLLDRFDHVLELFTKEYGLNEGPQTQPFERRLLQKGDGEEDTPYPSGGAQKQELDNLKYSEEGDRELIESVVQFTKVLLERCGNRSLYASSGHINDLLNTTSIGLLKPCLKLALRLAQRYQVARFKNSNPHAQSVLMANHYSFNVDNLHKLAMPFPKPPGSLATPFGATPGKGKDKAPQTPAYVPSDLVALAKEPHTLASKGDVASVHLTFYDQSSSAPKPITVQQPSDASPNTPTPVRRQTSALGPSRERPSPGDRSVSANDVTASTPVKSRETGEQFSNAPKVFSIPANKVSSTPAWALLREALPNIPAELRFDLLNRVRIAKALTTPEDSAQELMEVRLLAISNLAFALSESKFHERVGVPDNEEPKRLHLAQQLCDLLQPATNGQKPLSLEAETTVVLTLEALLKSRHKGPEVIEALSISVNHGVLYYELRKVVATLHAEEHVDKPLELRELMWREATFDLVNNLQIHNAQSRSADRMVQAGIIAILVEVLGLRTTRAERFYDKILQFFASFIHGTDAAFPAFANNRGFDLIADLVQHEVQSSLQDVKSGNGLPQQYKSKVIDYEVPFFKQATLRQLVKFTGHLFEHNVGANDRLLSNLIDTPQMLGSLKTIIESPRIFGSNVWCGAVNIVTNFIHSEPTSYSVVGEAGLPKSILEAVVGESIEEPPADADESTLVPELSSLPTNIDVVNGELQYPKVSLLPVGDAMVDIPAAFGAICLNDSHGMKLFKSSHAMFKFFNIFLSPPHVKALEDEGGNLAYGIGSGFDELARHHPRLKDQIVLAVSSMVQRVASLCRDLADCKKEGTKLWKKEGDTWYIDGGSAATRGMSKEAFEHARETGAEFKPTTQTEKVSANDVQPTWQDKGEAMRFLSACAKFLDGFFHNNGVCQSFCEINGAEHVLDLITAPSNPYDLPAFGAYNKLSVVLRTMCDQKPQLVLPSLIRRVQNALLAVKPIVDSTKSEGLFSSYIGAGTGDSVGASFDGTTAIKSLSALHALADVLGKTMAPPSYSSRHSAQTNQLFSHLNFTDVYVQLVDDLSKLHSACVWESLALQKSMPQDLKEKADPRPYIMRRLNANGHIELASESRLTESLGANNNDENAPRPDSPLTADQEYHAKNIRVLRYVFDQAPKGIESFFHTLGQAAVPKRHTDAGAKQHSSIVSERLAKAYLWELDQRKVGQLDEATELRYLSSTLQGTCRLMLKTSFSMDGYGPKEALTLVLHKFYLNDGFAKLSTLLDRFCEVIKTKPSEDDLRGVAARDGLYSILEFFGHVTRSKTITEAMHSNIISVRDHKQADYFMAGQFVVELRATILPAVQKLWSSEAIETLGESYVKKVIDILRVILKGEGEERAIRRSENASRRVPTDRAEFSLRQGHAQRVPAVEGTVHDSRLAREAVYRCNGEEDRARDYAVLRRDYAAPRFPIPEGESDDNEAQAPSDQSVDMEDADRDATSTRSEQPQDDSMSDDDNAGTLGGAVRNVPHDDLMAMAGIGRMEDILSITGGSAPGSGGQSAAPPARDTRQPFITVEDLEEKRKDLRDSLIDRCLEVLSAVPGITFELSDLINAAVAKSGEGASPRADIGSTLVSSLMSLQGEEPSKESGMKVSAYAHLVALILQDRDFFDSTLDELKEYFDALVAWVQLGQDQKVEDAPWLEMILLIIERVLAEDEQPAQIAWEPPPVDDPLKPQPEPVLPEPIVSSELRSTVFDALVAMLPKIGKSASLALSVCRVLVSLTRRRELAIRLSEKQSMQRLFLMVRQLAGSVDDKLQSCFLLILRHMVEDESMIRQIMRTEIKAALEGHRSNRAMDTATYTRNLYHLVLRDPKMFVEVTKDMLDIVRYDGTPHRGQALALKKDASAQPTGQDGQSKEAEVPAQPSIEGTGKDNAADEQKQAEAKPPVVESADGVMPFLLRELSNWKDVEDRPSTATKDTQSTGENPSGPRDDVEMDDDSATPTPAPPTPTLNASSAAPGAENAAKYDKPVFKPEEHTHYVYRAFLLQCLSELLLSYGRTKVEFINFSRKPETTPATPVKPRAGMLNYLLNGLIPAGTLEHKDEIAHRKKLNTSNWATTVLVSLCSKSTEKSNKYTRGADSSEEDTDLTFVRKFVLEHALRAFKEATTSTEPLDLRYSKLLGLGELFNRMLNKSERSGLVDNSHAQQVGRLMYEKNYIGALTSAIAEIDLNFPNAKRAVKYMLGPLRQLTDLGVTLSQNSDISSSAPGTSTEEDDISSATSMSDGDDDEREPTPDLLRNTALGMLESGGGEEDESEDEDEDEEGDVELYDDEYDEEMEYDGDDLEEPGHGDVVSDEDDDDNDGMGDVEGMPGDVDMDMEVVMDGEGEDDEDDMDDDEGDEDDESGDSDDEDGEDYDDQMDEITGDDENASMGEDGEDAWEEADDDEVDGSPHGGPLEHLAHIVGGDDRSDGEQDGLIRVDMGDGEDDYFEDEMPPEDEEDEEVDYENDVVYEPEMEEDEEDEEMGGWEFDAPAPPAIIRAPHHHHHHHAPPRALGDMFTMLGGGDPYRSPAFRSHRTGSAGRGEDDGTNPLLQREGGAGRDQPDQAGRAGRRGIGMPRGDILQDLVATVGAGGHGTINVSLGNMEAPVGMRGLPPMFQIAGRHGGHALIDIDPSRPIREQLGGRFGDWSLSQRLGNEGRPADNAAEARAVEFHLTPTVARWQEEARMVFGGKHHEKATRIIPSVLRVLVPSAMKAKQEHEKAERIRREAEEKAREEERKKAEAEKAEREAREKQEREEREAKEREEAAQREQEARETAQASGAAMEGVEQGQGESAAEAPSQSTAGEPQQPVEQVTTTIRGREIDITSLGVDRDFLEAIPEDMREEVIMQAVQEQRTQATQAGEQPTEIDREFLDALPRELQQELLRSEQADRRRRERAEQQRRAAEGGNNQTAQPEEMNNADFMAMLDPALRQAVLMDSDENTLAALPAELQAEARNLIGDHMPRGAIPAGMPRPVGGLPRIVPGGPERAERADQAAREASRQRRPVIQMLDKPGVATLLRLMFVSLHHKAKSNLHSILSDVCKNTQNRAEVISILLSILQDGTADVSAVERSFAQLSLKAKQLPGPKTPQPLKRTPTGLAAAPSTELSPLNIVQHCLTTLNALSLDNAKVPSFFLTEHETAGGQKVKATKKSKGKESKAAKYPLNALLALLDRKLITENTGVMETLATLLSRVTHPLTMLLRRAKEAKVTEKTPDNAPQAPAEQGEAQAEASDVPMEEATGSSTADAETSQQSASDERREDQDKSAQKPEDKKHRELTPPEVPDENIRLVVNILAARECPTKTFSDTLDIIKNLSAIPGAKEVFGRELVRQAQELGQTVVSDLAELAKQIESAETGTDLQGLALANFSSAGAKQRKLLRVILALDHLFDPKRMPQGPETESSTEPRLKDDVLALLYESSTFEQLWNNLTGCLAAIRRRGNMVNVATILLPLIESLMVVCRNSALKEAPASTAVTSPVDTSRATPPPDARMEGLFFKFTEDNRKILNELIRNNPKLMSGNLSILAKNSKVLEFDNKRTYFNRKLRSRGDARVPHPSLQLNIRRDNVFMDSYKSLYFKSAEEIKYGKLNIRFHGEEGIDAGGVSREWFGSMARQMFNPDYALFNPVASDRTTFHPNPHSDVNEEHLSFFKFIGRIIGKALYEGRLLDCHFSRAVYRRILGRTVSLKDMESLDLDYYRSLVWILENDITDVTFETFSVDVDRFGAEETVDLIPDGRNIPVTEENKQQYVQLVVEHRLITSVQQQLDKFLEGFHDIIPQELVSIFNEQELELLISGLPEIDLDDWKNNTEYHNYQATSPQIQWFWRAVRSFDKEEKAKLLQFITGTSKVPLNGFKELEGMNGISRFNIHRDYSSKEKLPSSHTCFNQLDLPEYESYEHLRQQLYTAITAGNEYFGFA